MKPLPPTLREKKRYIVFEVMGKNMPFVAVQQMMDKTLHAFLGDLGMAQAGVIHLADQYNYQKQKGIMRVNHKHVDHVKAAFTFTDTPVRSIGTSGVLKKAQTYVGGN